MSKIKNREYRLIKVYGLNLEEYDDMLEEQSNNCAICSRHITELNRPLVVDHDHNTRVLLCNNCNIGLGMFRDNQKTLLSAINYLQKATGKDELTDYDANCRKF